MSKTDSSLPPLPENASAVLSALRAGPRVGPPAEARQRTLEKIKLSVGLPGPGMGPPPPVAPGPAAGAAAPAATSLLKPLLLVASALGTAALVTSAVLMVTPRRPGQGASDPYTRARATRTPASVAAESSSPAEPPSVDPADEHQTGHRRLPRRRPGATRRRIPPEGVQANSVPPSPTVEAPVADSTLGPERSLLGQARLALQAGRLAEAERAIVDHRRRFHDGQLAEERDALSIRLRLRQGKLDEAREEARRFRARYPRSILLPALEQALRSGRDEE